MISKATQVLRAKGYVPPSDTWTPVDEALYGVENLLTLPLKKAEELRFKAIKHSFSHWYKNSECYQRYCDEFDFNPSKLKDAQDLEKVPLVSHGFFKTYLEGPDFSRWIAQVFIGELEEPKPTKSNPTLDDVIEAYGGADILVTYSSGTSGRFSFIPRDKLTFNRSQYCLGKMGIGEILGQWYEPEAYAFLLGPNPSKTNMWVGKVVTLMDHVFKEVQYAFDREITTQIARISFGDVRGLSEKLMAAVMQLIRARNKMIPRVINWLEDRERAGDKVLLAEAPFILQSVVARLEEEGRVFDFGERGAIITGGGWKTHDDEKISMDMFRARVEKTLGIPERNHVDLYTMCESNWHAIQCPEGHYLHLPPSIMYPMVLDVEALTPMGYGETGRFAFIDPLANSYPGAILTGDLVQLHEHCPVCGRTGPVLEPEVRRTSGEEIRGCAEEMRRLVAEQAPEIVHDLVCAPDMRRMPLMFLERRER